MKKIFLCLVFIAGFGLLFQNFYADEGMWPMSEIHKLDLRSKGLKIGLEDIYNPRGLSLIDGVVQLGGCSASFVSPQGLILTNHHCVFGAVQTASSRENDYINDGFLARGRSEEIQAKGMTARITESYQDVSEDVLSVVKEGMGLSERTKAVEKKIKEIVTGVEKEKPGKRAEVAEMFTGKTYVLFVYTYLKDIRLVYVPPRSIGEFGGEDDNWMWPRHTGDFAFVRAYTGPDGLPAEYSEKNVPYNPRKFIRVAPEGVSEGDFVFIFGYPGRTYRHQTSHFLAYEEEVRMPWVADWYAWQISAMEKMGENDRGVALKHSSRIKGLSNTMKNYRGKLKGMKRLHLVEKKRNEEKALQDFIRADGNRKAKYGDILERIGKVYEEMRQCADQELVLNYLRSSVNMVNFGYTAYEAAIELQKPDVEREAAYMNRNFPQTKQRLQLALGNYYQPTDRMVFKELLTRAANLPQAQRMEVIVNIVKGKNPDQAIDEFIDDAFRKTRLIDESVLMDALTKSPQQFKEMNDPFIQFAEALYPAYQRLRETERARKGALDQLYAELVDIKRQFLEKDFIPDANGTLRLTFGRIRGYKPADAVFCRPMTTLAGVIEKTTGRYPFDTPQKLIELYQKRDFGLFEHLEMKDVPVCVLYDTDTTGGNSGSPLLNARGELVGINFDRAFEATINDFAWSETYSRSIAVDIRYVLWVTQKFGGVEYLLKEMNVPVNK